MPLSFDVLHFIISGMNGFASLFLPMPQSTLASYSASASRQYTKRIISPKEKGAFNCNFCSGEGLGPPPPLLLIKLVCGVSN